MITLLDQFPAQKVGGYLLHAAIQKRGDGKNRNGSTLIVPPTDRGDIWKTIDSHHPTI